MDTREVVWKFRRDIKKLHIPVCTFYGVSILIQNVKYECFHRAFQIFPSFTDSVFDITWDPEITYQVHHIHIFTAHITSFLALMKGKYLNCIHFLFKCFVASNAFLSEQIPMTCSHWAIFFSRYVLRGTCNNQIQHGCAFISKAEGINQIKLIRIYVVNFPLALTYFQWPWL